MSNDDSSSRARWRALRRIVVGLAAIVAAAVCMVSLTRPPAGSGPTAARSPRVIQPGRPSRSRDEG